jgi:hypothetical protein
VFPASPAAGVYVKLNGELPAVDEDTEPAPSSVIVTDVALPPKVLPLNVIGVTPQVEPDAADNVTVGAFAQPQLTLTDFDGEIHPLALRANNV